MTTNIKLQFENDYQQKIMIQRFEQPTTLASEKDVLQWRSAWMGALSSWHSPYKVLVDCSNLSIEDNENVTKALEVMVKFFNGFFLRKIVGWGFDASKGHERLPFAVHATDEEAAIDAGVRQPKTRDVSDFRSCIQLQNHFQQHVIELSFAAPVMLATKDQVATLKSKLMNNLMQWHSKWSLLVDCTNLEVDPSCHADLERLLLVLRGFFMKEAIGYSPKGSKETYPFPTYRSRHKAAAVLEGEGNFSGDKADCKSRQQAT